MVYEITVKDGILRMDCTGGIFGSSIEDFDVVMARVIDRLVTDRKVLSIVLSETREHEYGPEQTGMLAEIASAIYEIIKERRLVSLKNLGPEGKCEALKQGWYTWLYNTFVFQIRGDPVGAYVNLLREIRHANILLQKAAGDERACYNDYLDNALMPIKAILERCTLLQRAEPFLQGYHIGDRAVYRKFFHPSTQPNFMFTKFMTKPPAGEVITRYSMGDTTVELFKVPGKVRPVYFIMPPEFKLSEEEYILLDDARRTLEQRKPVEMEMREQTRMRDLFNTIGKELIRDLADLRKFTVTPEQTAKLAEILTRYTAGFGVIEMLLADNNVEDISMNSPLGVRPIFIKHKDFEECETNLIPTVADGDRLATRFKLLSGRPLDEANPVLDTEIAVPGGLARVAAIGPRLSPEGLAFALRRFRFKPWTFPLYVRERFFDPLFGGLLWFMASYGRTVLIAGTRGAGKTSFLGSLMHQIIPYYRIMTIEDTFELPIESLRSLGYNVQRLKSRSVITKVELELPAEDALRTALRLGDSCLFVGEVRSVEARALYEAMRIGALANVVAGTIHGESAYGVFDRVVNDLGVPATSFKATDLVVVCNKLRTADGLHSFRRVTEVTEVRKHWNRDPLEEHGFINLMEYDSARDKLRPTDTFTNGESYILNEIARRVPGWAGRWDAVWDNIQLRSNILKGSVDMAAQVGKPELLEAPTTVASNQKFHEFSEKCRIETGAVDSQRVLNDWTEWFKAHAKTF
jgi:type IV secretory pathway ATPase VirB11/archaellum biosynthesis ATPase